ncbi:secreted RxLR effector protein 161-like [Juglans microcarpa x Juglans regia]|uniref:secreted RxLR effector protein 161-like n=1 Tax=Juglans microcarpa x Juglans regia TaxID=2249226 RepID=UPI001B7F2817|nr:secreted RxLR effector protein 161-like [Juglans microcarpa x Juglans regia]
MVMYVLTTAENIDGQELSSYSKIVKSISDFSLLKTQLSNEFEMKDLGAAQKILEMEIHRDRKGGRLYLYQIKYIEKVLERFGTSNSKPVVSVVSKYKANPSKVLWQVVKWILRYLRRILNFGLVFDRETYFSSRVVGYIDYNYAGDLDKRRSLTGYVFILRGSAISWKATMQSTIVLSITEAKYMVVAKAMKEVIWLKGLISDLGLQ